MARGRMIDRSFTKSKKLQSIARDHRLAYASILPFLDRKGRIIADPVYLRANVFRHTDFTQEEIAQAVAALAGAGLVLLYSSEDEEAIIQFVDFEKFNSPNAKESHSDLQGPDDAGSGACTCEEITNAPAMHVQSTGTAPALHMENVNGTSTLTKNVNEKHSSISEDLAPPDQPVAQARRPHIDYQEFTDTWNQQAHALPGVQKLNGDRKRAIKRLCDEHGVAEALGLFRDAATQVNTDSFWIERQYGIDNLLRSGRVVEKAEKLRNGKDSDAARLATEASKWFEAASHVN